VALIELVIIIRYSKRVLPKREFESWALSFVGGDRKIILRIKSYVHERNRVNESKCLAADEGQESATKKKKKVKMDHG